MGITMILSLLSGIALFLFGMSLMGDGLKRVAGNKLELILYRLTNTPVKGVLLGAGVTAIIFFRNYGNGRRVCKLRYDEGFPGDWHYNGGEHRDEYHRMDSVPFLCGRLGRDCAAFVYGYDIRDCGNHRYYF